MLLVLLIFISGGRPASPGFLQYIFHLGDNVTFKPNNIFEGSCSYFFPNKRSN